MYKVMCRYGWAFFWSFLALASVGSKTFADIYHYNNLIPGDRAMGFGGAYTALSEDASGVAYNPAGIAYATLNEISVSANAFYKTQTTYKKAIGDDNFVEEANGSLSPFFGGLFNLDSKMPGVGAAFGIYPTDTTVKNQNDLIVDRPLKGENIVRYHRSVHETASTVTSAGAIAKRFGNMSIGLAVGYLSVDELSQGYQDSKITATLDGKKVSALTLQDDRRELSVGGIEPVLGFKWKTSDNFFSIGIAVRKAMLLSQDYKRDLEKTDTIVDSSDVVQKNSDDVTSIKRTIELREDTKAVGAWPAELRFGLALMPFKSFTWALDISHRTATRSSDSDFTRKAVNNFHTGFEYKVTENVPLRFGAFTNNDTRPKLTTTGEAQLDHVDYVGGDLFIAYAKDESVYSLGFMYQKGAGKAQKLGSGDLQDVSGRITTFALAMTKNLTGNEEKRKCLDLLKEEKKNKMEEKKNRMEERKGTTKSKNKKSDDEK